jgi:hypothetical protein
MKSICLAVVALVSSVLGAGAQDHPDFSGTWTRIESSSDSWHQERIAQTATQIAIEREGRDTGGRLGVGYRDNHSYTIGGPPVTKKAADGSVRSVALSWDGPQLVFLCTTTEGANTTVEREAWSLGDGGDILFKDRRTTDWRGTRDGRVAWQRTDGHPTGFQAFGVAWKKCRTWVAERHGAAGAANLQWMLGYVTAYSVERSWRVAAGGDPSGKLRRTSADEIGQMIDSYCGERHPDSDLLMATWNLLEQLGGTRPEPQGIVREYR